MKRLLAVATFAALLALPAVAVAREHWFVAAADLTVDQEVPAPSVPDGYEGMGGASVEPNEEHTELTFHAEFSGLTGPLTMAHIHYGAPGEAGPPMFWLTDQAVMTGTDSPLSGTLTEADFMPVTDGPQTFAEALAATEAGDAYVNLHTQANSAGEIRGQLEVEMPDTATADEHVPASLPWTLALVAIGLAVLLPVARRFAWRIA